VEIYQNCNIFNDGAFEELKAPDTRQQRLLRLQHGEAMTFGADGDARVVLGEEGGLEVTGDTGRPALVHDAGAADPSRAFALSRLALDGGGPVPVGVFRDVVRPTYDDRVAGQIAAANGADAARRVQAVEQALRGADSWTVAAAPTR
jgi:2-oxoglutarate ferredoxin oxidoreductase subunit beta